MKISIDVVIPSFRLDEKYILPVLQLKKPANADVRYYLVVDNPSIVPAASISSLVDNRQVFLKVNPQNLGSGLTRNNGLEMGDGDWILFLDDDVVAAPQLLEVYTEAAIKYPEEIGFIGLVNLPPPRTSYTRALLVSGALDIFSIAAEKPSFAWGATANMMIKRSAIGNVRFTGEIPRTGGGEEVDFFMKIRAQNGYRNYKTLPEAAVEHPWWNNERPNLRKQFLYGKGNSYLPDLNPQHTYYDFLNTPETLLIAGIVTLVLLLAGSGWVAPMLVFIAGVLLIEILASGIQSVKRYATGNVMVIWYVMALRLAHETGVLWGKLLRLRFTKIGQRFHDNGVINKLYFYRTNTYKIVKWILYPLLVFYILRTFVW
jgi:glycosyltransferase involved in cell wall biosynthesis